IWHPHSSPFSSFHFFGDGSRRDSLGVGAVDISWCRPRKRTLEQAIPRRRCFSSWSAGSFPASAVRRILFSRTLLYLYPSRGFTALWPCNQHVVGFCREP